MPVPWIQIVQLMPSIVEVSRELLKRTRRTPPPAPAAPVATGHPEHAVLESRIAALEENERRQAELVTNIAEQLAHLTSAVTALHRQTRRLILGQATAVIVAVIAVLIALH